MHFKFLHFAVFAFLVVTLVDATPLKSRVNKSNKNSNNNAAAVNNNNNNAAAGNLAATLASSASNAARTRACDQGDQSLAAALQANVVVGLGMQATVVTLQGISADQAAANQLSDSVGGNNAVQRRAASSKASKTSSSQAKSQNNGSQANNNANSNANGANSNANSANSNANSANSNSANSNNNVNSNNNSSSNGSNSDNNNNDNSSNSSNSTSSSSNSDFQTNVDRLSQFMQTSALLIQAAQEIADDNSFAQPQLQILANNSTQLQLVSQLTGDASTDAQTLDELFASFVTNTGVSQDGVNNALIDCFLPLTTVSG